MTVDERTWQQVRDLRIQVSGIVDDEVRHLVRAWGRAWDEITSEWEAAIADVLAAGDVVTVAQARRLRRAEQAATAAYEQITSLSDGLVVRVTDAAGLIVDITRLGEAQVIAAQMPAVAGPTARLAVTFDRVNPAALQAIVTRTTQQVTALSMPLAPQATEAMLRALVRAVPQGLSPREAARRMLDGVETEFMMPGSRALTIARTEILDAHREAAYQQHQANSDVLAGWVWTAQLDAHTCVACVAMHGTEHPLSEHGPIGHQNCRCARTPLTRSWADLGFPGIPDRPSVIEPGEEWLTRQPEATQIAVMGPARYAAYQAGTPLADMATVRHTTGWRDSIVPTPARDLVAA